MIKVDTVSGVGVKARMDTKQLSICFLQFVHADLHVRSVVTAAA